MVVRVSVSYDRLPTADKIVLDTVNGSCRISVPKDSNFNLHADSVNGGISCDLPITLKKSGRNHLSGTVGAGGVTIKLDSVNGGLSVVAK